MASASDGDQRAAVKRTLSWALVGALCVAALTAIGAILTGDFDETDARVIGTSLGFAVFSATGASGATLRAGESENLRALGLATMALSAVAFFLLVGAVWSDGAEDLWRWFGSVALAALACSHVSLVSGALRNTDSPSIRLLSVTSITLGLTEAFFGILAVSGAVEEVDDGFGQVMAVLVILLLLTTALPPILRRLQRTALASAPRAPATSPTLKPSASSQRSLAPLPLATEVLATADRIQALNDREGCQSAEITRECERTARARPHLQRLTLGLATPHPGRGIRRAPCAPAPGLSLRTIGVQPSSVPGRPSACRAHA